MRLGASPSFESLETQGLGLLRICYTPRFAARTCAPVLGKIAPDGDAGPWDFRSLPLHKFAIRGRWIHR